MYFKKYPNLEEALNDITREDKNYILIRHTLKRKEKVAFHYHPNADEWIILSNGNCEIICGDTTARFSDSDAGKELIAILLPKTQKHSFLAISKICYFVLRDKNDITVSA